MVRLVFRPYTQLRQSICTSESLRASTRVSPGFTLLRHSSPSFGSQQICSHSNLSRKDHGRLMVHPNGIPPSHFHSAPGFATQTLAYMLDSLVRVSRRVGWKDQVKLLSEQVPVQPECTTSNRSTYQRQCYNHSQRSRPQRR